MTLNSGGMAPGQYTAALRIRSNDPLQPEATVPVAMTVVLDMPYRVYLPLVLRNLGPWWSVN